MHHRSAAQSLQLRACAVVPPWAVGPDADPTPLPATQRHQYENENAAQREKTLASGRVHHMGTYTARIPLAAHRSAIAGSSALNRAEQFTHAGFCGMPIMEARNTWACGAAL